MPGPFFSQRQRRPVVSDGEFQCRRLIFVSGLTRLLGLLSRLRQGCGMLLDRQRVGLLQLLGRLLSAEGDPQRDGIA